MINNKIINDLIYYYKDDKTVLHIIEKGVMSFEEYHNQIFKLELWISVYQSSCIDKDYYRNKITELGESRKIFHDALIANVRILNRIAKKHDLPPVYDGIVSLEKPYRRNIADAVFECVENVIKSRH